jgi:hypothetical protein
MQSNSRRLGYLAWNSQVVMFPCMELISSGCLGGAGNSMRVHSKEIDEFCIGLDRNETFQNEDDW